MNEQAFFFQGDTLLLPAGYSGSKLTCGFPLELAGSFTNPDIFSVPALDTCETIHIVSVLPCEDPSGEAVLPENWKGIPVRQVLAVLSTTSLSPGKILRACHIAQWRQNSRFCGRCGSLNIDAGVEIQRRCLRCGNTEFPRICPAIIAVITDNENRILLAHNKKFKTGVYSHISGFNEAGESLEETVIREVREEVNIEVHDIVYAKSQPWPFPNSLMLGFTARYLSGTIQPDGTEIEDAKWFSRDNLPKLPGEGSLSRYLINRWLDGTLQKD